VELTPQEIVAELDRYIIGQEEAKRAVAIALRNRYRRRLVAPELRDEILPKNILMIGPTGVGKTEIARRLARLAKAPFVKVEATKFTEVGYVGRDVDSIIRELVDGAIRIIQAQKLEEVEEQAKVQVEERLVELLAPDPAQKSINPMEALFGLAGPESRETKAASGQELAAKRQRIKKLLQLGELEDQIVEVMVEKQHSPLLENVPGMGMEDLGINFREILGGFLPKKMQKKKMPVRQAREVLLQKEAAKLLDMEAVLAEAAALAEESGLVFIDEIDKIAGGTGGGGPDVSREGVQRDILPIIEGSTVLTKAGPVRTDHILFIAAGAFHLSKPADLIPELQGRFPIRVNLKTLLAEDFAKILTEPQNSLTKQYTALLATEGIELDFRPEGIAAIAKIAEEVNKTAENIGARRLHTILERLLEEASFAGREMAGPLVIDEAYVQERLREISQDSDLSKYIL